MSEKMARRFVSRLAARPEIRLPEEQPWPQNGPLGPVILDEETPHDQKTWNLLLLIRENKKDAAPEQRSGTALVVSAESKKEDESVAGPRHKSRQVKNRKDRHCTELPWWLKVQAFGLQAGQQCAHRRFSATHPSIGPVRR